MPGTNCTKLANNAGARTTNGGTKTSVAGMISKTGTITTTTSTNRVTVRSACAPLLADVARSGDFLRHIATAHSAV